MLVTGLVAVATCLASPVPATAASGAAVIADCNSHDTLTRTYSIAQLESALRTMPADVAEYSACHDVIQRALLAQQGKLHRPGAGGGGSSGSSFLPTPLIVVLAVLLVAAATLAALAVRRRRTA